MGTVAAVTAGRALNNINSVGSNYGMQGLPPDVALEEQALNRKQQIANLLLQQGMQGAGTGQMVGRFFVPTSASQHAAGLGQVLAGALGTRHIDTQRQDMAQGMNAERAKAIQEYAQNLKSQPVTLQGPGAPELTGLGQQLNKDMDLDPRLVSGQEMQSLAERTPDVVQEGPRPMGTQMVPLSADEQRQKILAGLTHQDPRVQQAVRFMEQQKAQEADKIAQHSFLSEQRGLDRDVRREGIEANVLTRLEQMKNTAALTAMQIDARDRAGQDSNDLKRALADQTSEIKRLELQGRKEIAKGHDATLKEIAGMRVQGAQDVQAMKGATGRPLPGSIGQKFMDNSQNLRMAENALQAIQDNRNATGIKGYLPDAVLQRVDPKGVETRSAIANLGSMIIHDRSGAAVTVSEFPRLRPFIPLATDGPDVAEKKLKQFVTEYQKINQEMTEFYQQAGYTIPEEWHSPGGTPAPQSAPASAPTATGPGGQKLILKDGQWQLVQP